MSGKVGFAALPVRAIGDSRLSALELRVLACIAYHDRMSGPRGQGQGAWASNETLAGRVGCHYTRLSSAVTKLAQLGYLEREPHPLNKRLRVYRVRYEEPADSLRDGKESAVPIVGETANDQTTILCEPANPAAATVCRPVGKTEPDQSIEPVEYIPRSGGRDFAEATESNSAKAARLAARGCPQRGNGNSISAKLARLERRLNHNPDSFMDCQLEQESTWLGEIEIDDRRDDDERGRARRLGEFVDTLLQDRADDARERRVAR